MTKKDLIGLENLECLSMYGNNLTTLPDDLFTDMKKLQRISFFENQLERLSSKLLEPIERTLEFASFERNLKINENLELSGQRQRNLDLARFKNTIDRFCLPPERVPVVEAIVASTTNQHKKMLNEFANFRASGDFTDFSITFRGKEHKVHKCVLAAQSSVFKEMFTNNAAVGDKTFKKIKNFSEDGFVGLLDYFYTAELDDGVNAIEMFGLATVFGVPNLQALCVSRISELLDQSNALEVFNLGHQHKSEELKQSAFKIIQEMFPDMDDTFIDKLDDVNYILTAMTEIEARLKKV